MHVKLTSSTLSCPFENLRKQVLVLSPDSRSVSEVGASEVVPWPVIWSLARYHRSHVWYTGTRPRMEALVHDFSTVRSQGSVEMAFQRGTPWDLTFIEEFQVHSSVSTCDTT